MRVDSDIHAGMKDRARDVRAGTTQQVHVRTHRTPVTIMHLDLDVQRRNLVRDFFHNHACLVRDGDDWEVLVEDFRYMSFDALMLGVDQSTPDTLITSIEQLRLSRRLPIVVLCRSVTPAIERIAVQLRALTISSEPYDLAEVNHRLCETLSERDQ